MQNKLNKEETRIKNEAAIKNSKQYILHNENFIKTQEEIKLLKKYNNIDLKQQLKDSIKQHDYK